MKLRPFGTTGRSVTPFGLGGEGVLRTHGREQEADAVIRAAIDSGVSYYDSARAYDGSEDCYGRIWSALPAIRASVFITSKSASRDAAGAWRDLQTTLETMKVDAIDLWQIHDLRTTAELEAITAKGGALESFLRAKEEGLVRHIGVTGHHDPEVLERAVRELPVESVLLPINPAEGVIGGFLDRVIPEARSRGVAVVGMKAFGQGVFLNDGFSPSELLRYALAQGANTIIVGCSTPAEVEENVHIAQSPTMDEGEQLDLLDRIRPRAQALAYYRGVSGSCRSRREVVLKHGS